MELKETWKPIPSHCGTGRWWTIANFYEASSLGRIRNKKTGNILHPTVCGGNRLTGEEVHHGVSVYCSHWKSSRFHVRVSHLVWAAFTGEPVENVRIYHIDGNPFNNAFYNLATTKHLKKLGLR